jgi:serine/threonine protein kinase
LKIGDFGISKRVEDGLTALRSFKGTFGFLAPEILVQQKLLDLDDTDFKVSEEYTVAVDMWSLGEIAFRALTTKQPFPISSLRAFIKGTLPFPVKILQDHGVTKEGCDFLKSLMTPVPKDRLTARDALTHIWIEPQKPASARVSAEMQRYLFLNIRII